MHVSTSGIIPVEHHRWHPDRHTSHAAFNRVDRAILHEMRWREPDADWRQNAGLLALVLALHVLMFWCVGRLMQPHPVAFTQPRTDAVIVRLIENPTARLLPPPPPMPELPQRGQPAAPPPPRAVSEPVRKNAMQATMEPASKPQVYDRNGQVVLPQGGGHGNGSVPQYRSRQMHEPALMKHGTPVPYKPTRFENDWAPTDESVLGKAVRKTTVEGNVLPLPGGYHLKCAVAVLALGGGCGIAGPQEQTEKLKVEYRRDNLAPAQPLVDPVPARSAVDPARAASTAKPAARTPHRRSAAPAGSQSDARDGSQ